MPPPLPQVLRLPGAQTRPPWQPAAVLQQPPQAQPLQE
jgi:hypothetical protein